MASNPPCTSACFVLCFVLSQWGFACWFVIAKTSGIHYPSVAVSSLNVSSFNISSSSSHPSLLLSSASWDLSISFNASSEELYDRINASIFYGPHRISEQSPVLPFDQWESTIMTLEAHPTTHAVYLQRDAADAIVEDHARLGFVGFQVRLVARAREVGKWGVIRRSGQLIGVVCQDVKIRFSPTSDGGVWAGRFLGPTRKCQVYEGGLSHRWAY